MSTHLKHANPFRQKVRKLITGALLSSLFAAGDRPLLPRGRAAALAGRAQPRAQRARAMGHLHGWAGSIPAVLSGLFFGDWHTCCSLG